MGDTEENSAPKYDNNSAAKKNTLSTLHKPVSGLKPLPSLLLEGNPAVCMQCSMTAGPHTEKGNTEKKERESEREREREREKEREREREREKERKKKKNEFRENKLRGTQNFLLLFFYP